MINKLTQQEYEKDFYAWTMHNAELIRQGKLSEVDLENVAEEIESMGKRERREMRNKLAILIAHLLIWKYQPEQKDWEDSYIEIALQIDNQIEEQRFDINELLEESPSLKYELEKQVNYAYKKARFIVSKEVRLHNIELPKLTLYPLNCPFSLKEILGSEYLPAN